jgi:hypothetical protein
VYQWRAGATDRFDSGLVRPDGTARRSLAVLAGALSVVASPRVTATWSSGRLAVRVACGAPDGWCRGRVALTLRLRAAGSSAWRSVALGVRRYATTAAAPAARLTVRVPAALRRRARVAARLSLRAQVRPTVPTGAAATSASLALARPAP